MYYSCEECKSWEQEVEDLKKEIEYLNTSRREDEKYYEKEIQFYQLELKKLNKRMQLLLGKADDEDEL